MIDGMLAALEASTFAMAVRSSPFLYPAANVTHVVGIALLFFAVAIMDVRVLGGLRPLPLQSTLRAGRRGALAGLGLMAVSGFPMFAAEATHIAANPAFVFKLQLIGLALANALLFEVMAGRAIRHGRVERPALPARCAAGLSLLLWIGVIATGRLIAYF